jgi:hypothetical protein
VSNALNTLAAAIAAIPPAPVSSVFGRIGAVVAAANDYAASQVSNDSSVSGANVKLALNTLLAAIPSVPVSSVFGRIGAVVAAANDYAASQVSNDSSVSGANVKLALNTLDAAIAAIVTSTGLTRDAIWDQPSAPSADDDEFTTDGLANGTWLLTTTAQPLSGAAYTRAGAIDLTATISANTFRSSVIGSTLYVQVPQNTGVTMWKRVGAALTTKQLLWVAVGLPYCPAASAANDPYFAVGMWKDLAGRPDTGNNYVRSHVRTSNDAHGAFALKAGAGAINTVGGFLGGAPFFVDGVGVTVDPTTGTNNAACWIWTRRGGISVAAKGSVPQFNASTDHIGFQFQSSPSGANGSSSGVIDTANSSSVFAFHFLRRCAAAGGFIAQS